MTSVATTQYRRHPNNKGVPGTVPKVRLYVEHPDKQDTWFVNVGHVTDRGRWRTEPHAHPHYAQVIFVHNGRGVMNLEGHGIAFEGPCALLLPTECVHGLDYEVDVDKWVVTMDVTYLAQVNAKLPEFTQLWALPRIIALASESETATELYKLITRLEREIDDKPMGHIVGTEALLTSLLLMLLRAASLAPTEHEGATHTVTHSATRMADRFRELIDEHFRQNLRLQNYASMMAVSPTQLRAACAAATGQNPTKMIHARLIIEAKRSLIFGSMSIEQIAYGLGFADTAYFTRFFRKEVGQSPSQFRMAARHQPHSAG